MVDSEAPISACPKCNSEDICDTYQLEGRNCPFCKKGVFAIDPRFNAIS